MPTTSRDLTAILSGGSQAFRRLNGMGGATVLEQVCAAQCAPRLRQSIAPMLNKTEQAAMAYLQSQYPRSTFTPHLLTFRIANGCRYTPDLVREEDGALRGIYEVKGVHAWDDAIVKAKVAATRFPWAQLWLMSPADRGRTRWRIERVMP